MSCFYFLKRFFGAQRERDRQVGLVLVVWKGICAEILFMSQPPLASV
jgi:hypothetical protein